MKSPLVSIPQSPLSTSITNSPLLQIEMAPHQKPPPPISQPNRPETASRLKTHSRHPQGRSTALQNIITQNSPETTTQGQYGRTYTHALTTQTTPALSPPSSSSSSSSLESHADAHDDSIRNGRRPKLHPNYSTTSLTLRTFQQQQQQQHRLPLADVQAMEAASEGSFGNSNLSNFPNLLNCLLRSPCSLMMKCCAAC